MPKFTGYQYPAVADPNIVEVGTNWGPSHLPDQMITLTPGQIRYQDLFSSLGPNGEPARTIYPGSFGHTTGAMGRA